MRRVKRQSRSRRGAHRPKARSPHTTERSVRPDVRAMRDSRVYTNRLNKKYPRGATRVAITMPKGQADEQGSQPRAPLHRSVRPAALEFEDGLVARSASATQPLSALPDSCGSSAHHKLTEAVALRRTDHVSGASNGCSETTEVCRQEWVSRSAIAILVRTASYAKT